MWLAQSRRFRCPKKRGIPAMRQEMQTMLAVAALAVAACSTGGGAPAMETAADSAGVRELATKYVAAWNATDAAAMSALATDDYHAAEPDGSVINGRAAFDSVMKAEFEGRKAMPATTPPMMMELTPVKVVFVTATTAVSTGLWAVKGVPAGSGPDKGSYLVVSVKGADGVWRMRNGLGAAYVAPPAAPGPVKK